MTKILRRVQEYSHLISNKSAKKLHMRRLNAKNIEESSGVCAWRLKVPAPNKILNVYCNHYFYGIFIVFLIARSNFVLRSYLLLLTQDLKLINSVTKITLLNSKQDVIHLSGRWPVLWRNSWKAISKWRSLKHRDALKTVRKELSVGGTHVMHNCKNFGLY